MQDALNDGAEIDALLAETSDTHDRRHNTLCRSGVVPENLSSADSRDEAESAHHPARCLPPSICLGRLSPTYSSRNAGLKSRISFSAISSILL